MKVACIGLHKRFCEDELFDQLYENLALNVLDLEDSVILKTCNRIEIYFESFDLENRHPEVLKKLIPPFHEHLSKRFYTYLGQDVLSHLAKVASGLDSLILGETDIQAQVRKAYAMFSQNLGADGHFLFQKALQISKKVRTQFDLKPKKGLIDQVLLDIQKHLKPGSRIALIGLSDWNMQLLEKLVSLGTFEIGLVSNVLHKLPKTFHSIQKLSYEGLNNQQWDAAIIATVHRKITDASFLKKQALAIDISRPRVFFSNREDLIYKDLNVYENRSLEEAIYQKQKQLEALLFIDQDVESIYEARQKRKEFLKMATF